MQNYQEWLNELLRHPLFIASISTLLFGAVVAYLGSKFQHKNWKEQNTISHRMALEDKLFEKRADIIREMFFLLSENKQNAWALFHKSKAFIDAHKAGNIKNKKMFYGDIKQFVENDKLNIQKTSALAAEIKIFFDIYKDSALLVIFVKIVNDIEELIERIESLESITKAQMSQIFENIDKQEDDLQHILGKNIYSLTYYKEATK